MGKSIVSIVKTKQNPGYDEIRQGVDKALNLIGGIRDVVKPGQMVLIKPNWCAPPADRESAVLTLPEVAKAVADVVKEMGARPVIAESAAVGVDTEKVIAGSGYHQLREAGYEVVDLKQTKKVMLPVSNGKVFKQIQCFAFVKEADVVISLPKLKTHDQAEMTCSIKNLKGLESDAHKIKTHKVGLFDGVVDLLSIIKPGLALVDAIICQEGIGPIYGKPVEMDLIIAGRDLVATDAVCGRIIGYEPSEIMATVKAAERGFGTMDFNNIEVVGQSIKSVSRRFLRPAEDNPVDVEDFNWIADFITCTGCRNTVMSTLVDMRKSDQLDYLHGVTLITGPADIPAEIPRDSIVTVGNCVPKELRGPRWVKGCPPNNAYVVQAILAGRGEVKRMYSEEALEKTG